MVRVSSWGRLGSWEHDVRSLSDRYQVANQLKGTPPGIAYGMGRSYGDVCLNPDGVLWKVTGLDRFISFDQNTGRLVCEAGVLLRDIQRMVIPRGWILPVTPGTQLVTVGGAIANDVHGKSHHVCGSFGDHVQGIILTRTDGATFECGPALLPEWFASTIGGAGLTGVITEADIQLRRVAGPWLETETLPYADLNEFFRLADDSEAGWEHTVSWIDCVSGGGGRSLHARQSDFSETTPRAAGEKTDHALRAADFPGQQINITTVQHALLPSQKMARRQEHGPLRIFLLPARQSAGMEPDVWPQGFLPVPKRSTPRGRL